MRKLKLISLVCITLSSLLAANTPLIDIELDQMVAANHQKNKRKNRDTKKAKYRCNTDMPDQWKPYFRNNRTFLDPTNYMVNYTIGVGFLYFSGIEGNTATRVGTAFLPNISTSENPIAKYRYMKTPVFEYNIGLHLWDFLAFSLSYQTQNDISLYTYVKQTQSRASSVNTLGTNLYYLRFDSLAVKFWGYLPYSMIFKSVMINPYLAVGVGPSWITSDGLNTFGPAQLRDSANCFFTADLGLKTLSQMAQMKISILFGFKFNIWGQIRNVGKFNHSPRGSLQLDFLRPFSVKTVYQFAPYIGAEFDF